MRPRRTPSVSRYLVCLALLPVLLGCGGSSATGAEAAALDPAELTLRLSDLSGGYQRGDDSGCGIGVEGAPPRLAALVVDRRPTACVEEFEQLYRPLRSVAGNPPLIKSIALVFADEEGARAGFALGRELVEYTTGARRLQERTNARIGAATRVFSAEALVRGRAGQPASVVLWRSRSVVAIVLAGGVGGEGGRQAALRLARKQQGRIANPEPIVADEENDREVALDNPAIGIDIYWLGRSFAPGGDLHELTLADTFGPITPGGGPGNVVKIDYGAAQPRERGITLDLWRPAAWKRFLGTRLGRLVWGSPCARARTVALPKGRAVIHSGYGVEPAACSGAPFDRFLAHVYLPGVVVAVNMPYCYTCAPRFGGSDPYNSLQGMETIVRALERRPKA